MLNLAVVIGDTVVRSMHVDVKFDRVSGTFFITQLNELETFDATGSRTEFTLKWPMDMRTNTVEVTVSGELVLNSDYDYANTYDSDANLTYNINNRMVYNMISSSFVTTPTFNLQNYETISSRYFFVRVRNSDYNYTTNPTIIDSNGNLLYTQLVFNPQTYISTYAITGLTVFGIQLGGLTIGWSSTITFYIRINTNEFSNATVTIYSRK